MINGFTVLIPIAGGLLTASWGAYKDSPYEGFSKVSFVRSVLITILFYFLLDVLSQYKDSLGILMLSAVACERITQEFCKAFFCKSQRAKIYKIPQSFHVLGKVVSYKRRLFFGTILTTLVIATFWLLNRVIVNDSNWILFGLVLATLPSVGGAWKDAPIEGFDFAKFPRSFLIMFGSTWLLHASTQNLFLLVMAAAGLERLLVEFFKTFIVKSVPGKFVGNVISPEWLKRRDVFIVSYGIGVAIILLLRNLLA